MNKFLNRFKGVKTREQRLVHESQLLSEIPDMLANHEVSISKWGEVHVGSHVDFEHYITEEHLKNNPDLKFKILAAVLEREKLIGQKSLK